MVGQPAELTPQQGRCIELRYHGLTQQEIAERLGIHQSRVCRHLQKARDKLGVRRITVDPLMLDQLDPSQIAAIG